MSQLSITTTQNVNINFNAASIGERMLAHLIDFAVKVAYGLVVYYVIFVMMGLNDVMEGLDYWSAAAITVLFMLPVFFYSLVQESLWEGKTIGKYVMKMRVIKIDGYQAGFGEYLIRWIMRIIDGGIAFGLIGLITMMVSNKVQRLGDMAAGTAVISLKNDISINHTILKEVNNMYVPVYPMVIKLSDNDVRIIKETYETSLKSADFVMISRIQAKIEAVTGIKSVSANATAFVDTVLHDYNYYTQNM